MGPGMSERAAGATRAVDLPERVVERVEARLPYTEFESVEEYVGFALEEVLASVEEREDPEPVDEREVRDRLESLGYLE